MDDKTSKALFDRLQRMEARVVRGFTELGVDVCDAEDWIRIDHDRGEVYMKGGGRSLKAIQLAIAKSVGYNGKNYTMFVAGSPAGVLFMEDVK